MENQINYPQNNPTNYNNVISLLINLLIMIIIIIALLYVSFLFSKNADKKEFVTVNDMAVINSEDLNISSSQTATINTIIQPSSVSTQMASISEINKNDTNKTKQVYKKLEEIALPSSLDKNSGGYIGRDFVCFREKTGDQSYMSKRNGCMACQVDNRNNGLTRYAGTNTNVVSTCVYTTDQINPDDPYYNDVWSKTRCENECKKIADL